MPRQRRAAARTAVAAAVAVSAAGAVLVPPAAAQGQPRAAAHAASAASAAAAVDAVVRLEAAELTAQPDAQTLAQGDVHLTRGPLELRADRLSYDQPSSRARALGQVFVRMPAGRFSGPELELSLDTYAGFFIEPRFELDRFAAGGRAQRFDFLDRDRAVALGAWYTSCPREDGDRPAWRLETDRVALDFERNEGVAEGAVVRFFDVPILALPTMSFPLGDGRKSGWLPPTLDFDTRSGLSVAVPYYWNIAPDRDATLTPHAITRRGLRLDTEYRWLEEQHSGRVQADVLPWDRLARRARWSVFGEHDGEWPDVARWHVDGVRVSDDGWWKDFPRDNRSLEPRLLPLRLGVERSIDFAGGRGLNYARVVRWQVLQGSDLLVVSPYERAPQIGAAWRGALGGGLLLGVEGELNRFVRPDQPGTAAEPYGWRAHTLATLERPWRGDGWWLLPRATVNAARYRLDPADAAGRTQAQRVIPTFSLAGGLEFERDVNWFGRALRQTLEPRVLWVNTPWRDQSALPNFDSAGKDFNFNSIFSENAFSGIDRVSDAHQITAGLTTRVIDPATGAEAARLGIVQRYLLREQRITPEGVPYTQRLSDVFLIASGSLLPGLSFDGAFQYNPNIQRPVRTVASARWNPEPYKTVGLTYRFARGLAEQVDVGWQWPLWKTAAGAPGTGSSGGGSACGGSVYSVGRLNYSLRDRRLVDSLLGFEYDAGCWIGRVVAERLSTGRSEATTHILLQLELVGLSRLGSNPLRVLKDNVPGYRLLRDERGETTPPPPRYD